MATASRRYNVSVQRSGFAPDTEHLRSFDEALHLALVAGIAFRPKIETLQARVTIFDTVLQRDVFWNGPTYLRPAAW